MTKPGGLSNVKSQDESVKELLKGVIDQVKDQTSINCNSLSVHSYKTQVVAGVIYYIKVIIDDNKYAHLKIIKHLSHTNSSPQLLNHMLDKSIDDEIIFF